MRTGGGLTFYIAHPRWGAPQRVEAAVLDNAGRAIVNGSYATREGGRVYLAGVPSGSWNLLVASDSSAVVSAAVTVPGSPPRLTLAGRATVGALPAGSWRVEVTTDDGRSWNHTAQVAPGATAEVRLG
jgi:hypothetical protein